jgi:hypothetical protein
MSDLHIPTPGIHLGSFLIVSTSAQGCVYQKETAHTADTRVFYYSQRARGGRERLQDLRLNRWGYVGSHPANHSSANGDLACAFGA